MTQLRHRLVEPTSGAADGVGLAVQEAGPPDAPALLLLPGQANSHGWWTGLRERFTSGFRTLTFDYRGTGATRAPEEPWSTTSFARDAVAVLDAYDVPRAHVYGTSMGGRVAQVLALVAPDRVDRLVLACTSPGGAAAYERSREVRLSLAQTDAAARTRALLELMYTPAWFTRERRSHLLGDASMTRRAQTLHLRVSARHDASDRLTTLCAPTLVLHGTEDRMSPPANAETLARLVPGAELALTEGGRHGFFDEFADDVTARVLDFLST